VREGKYGRFRTCTRFPRCKWSAPLVVGQCPVCGSDLVERKGKRGAFWGCSRYPECRYTQEPQLGHAPQHRRFRPVQDVRIVYLPIQAHSRPGGLGKP
jgi:ssDNA-binding Zn-finger/Zn-ribbon topoisomerase 1